MTVANSSSTFRPPRPTHLQRIAAHDLVGHVQAPALCYRLLDQLGHIPRQAWVGIGTTICWRAVCGGHDHLPCLDRGCTIELATLLDDEGAGRKVLV